jgi:hypothetical protein
MNLGISFTVSVLVFTSVSLAGPMKEPYIGSKEFEKMKSLAGTWTGEMDMGRGPQPLTVEYRVVSGGSAIEERTFAGTPMEMVTMYHDKGGRLAMTHYCSLHNRPGMVLKSSDDTSIHFDFDPTCGVDAEKEMHMHSLVLKFDDADTMTQTWTLYEGGEPGESHPMTLKRVKS